jgi:two-component system sensor histidine kinase KdpD
MIRSRGGWRWLLWTVMLLIVTVVLVAVRQETEQMYVPLTFLLVVLGGSAGGGRALGFTLAGLSFVIINYFLQPPYDSLWIGKSLDFVTLAGFFATAGVATQLLDQARRERDEALRRADEVMALSRLGSESLSSARAADAVAAVASMIRVELGVAECEIIAAPLERARSVGTDARELTLPLYVHDQAVGTLVLRNQVPIVFRREKRYFLEAISYYAALALERARLAREADRVTAVIESGRMKDFVLASVSHDLRTPLTTIKALAQDTLRSGTDHAGEIEVQADRLSRLVADLLDLSRLRAGGFRVDVELNAAEDVVGAVLRQCEPLFEGRQLVAPFDEHAPALYGNFDFVQTLRILVNLTENAIRFTPEGADVELSAAREGAELVFRVADRGPGIVEHERERVFDAFYRPEGSIPDRGRAGLGLAIARSLAKAQYGTLNYRARFGGGSVFELRLPAADVDEIALLET